MMLGVGRCVCVWVGGWVGGWMGESVDKNFTMYRSASFTRNIWSNCPSKDNKSV